MRDFRLTIELDETDRELVKALKRIAFERDIYLRELLIEILRQYVQRA